MDWLLLPLSVPGALGTTVITISIIFVVTASPDDDDHDGYTYEYYIFRPLLSFCCIPKSIIDKSAILMDTFNYPVLTASKNAISDTIHDVLHLRIPVSFMMTYWWCKRKRRSEFKNQYY